MKDEDTFSMSDEVKPVFSVPDQGDPQALAKIITSILDEESSLPVLGKGVTWAGDCLEIIGPILDAATAKGIEVSHLIRDSQRLRATPTGKVLIGVCGSSGAGKSSLLNALLDERGILVTSSKQACTAAVTSIRYNPSNNPEEAYIIKVEYLDAQSWQQDIELALRDLNEEFEDELPDMQDLQISSAKLKAVYRTLTDDQLRGVSAAELVAQLEHPEVLGTSITYVGPKFKDLKRVVERIVKGQVQADQAADLAPLIPTVKGACWPLIREIKIYTKAPLLSTGLVLVDLPGTEDSNAARAAVARNYRRNCTRLLLVAAINRAVSEKGLHEFMSEAAQFDLARRSAFNTITIVCTKTDDINVDQIVEEYDVSPELKRMNRTWKKVNAELQHLQKRLQKKMDQRKSVANQRASPSKRLKSTHEGRDEDVVDVAQLAEIPIAGKTPSPCANNQSANKRKSAEQDNDLEKLDAQIKTLEERTSECEAQCSKFMTELHRQCIAERNEWVSDTMTANFKEEVEAIYRDLDQKKQSQARDCSRYTSQLKVHTVCSEQYQKKKGRFARSFDSPGFPNLASTGIPGLQKDLKQMAADSKIPEIRLYLRRFLAFLNSLAIYTTSGADTLEGAREQNSLQFWLGDHFSKHSKKSELDIQDSYSAFHAQMKTLIYDHLPGVAAAASDKAVTVVSKWGPSHNGVGFKVATYKAGCRREGYYKQPKTGLILDFNGGL